MKKKKICLVLYNKKIGGAEKVTFTIFNDLSDCFNIRILYLEEVNELKESEDSLKLNSSDSNFGNVFVFLKRTFALRKYKKNNEFDIVVSFLPFINVLNAFTKLKEKTVLSIHSFSDINKYNAFENLMFKVAYTIADKIIVISKKIETEFARKYPELTDKSVLLYNPITINTIENKAQTGHVINFIYAGKIVWYKGVIELITAFSKVKNEKIRLKILGRDLMDGTCQKLVENLNENKRIEFINETDKPLDYLKKADVFVLNSFFEGYPVVLVEALSCGLPIISTDCESGPSEILRKKDKYCNGICECEEGLLIKPYKFKGTLSTNSDEIVELLEKAIIRFSDYEYIKSKRLKAYERFEELKKQNSIEKYKEFFDKV